MGIEFVIRSLTEADGGLLARATLGNLNWCGTRFSQDDIVSRPEFGHYTVFVPSRGDFGLVAEHAGGPVAVAWALFLPGDDPGYGYVDEATPEFSLWVTDRHRGRGLGHRLTHLLQEEARARGVRRIGLSVEEGNDAKRIYRAMGFTDAIARQADGLMIWAPPTRDAGPPGDTRRTKAGGDP